MHARHHSAFLIALLVSSAAQSGDNHAQHALGAHQHGVAELNLAIEGSTIELELITPADNLLGFEHHPLNKSQQALLNQVEQSLRQGSGFRFNAGAHCHLEHVAIGSDLLAKSPDADHHQASGNSDKEKESDHSSDHHHGDHPQQNAHHADGHSAFHVHYQFQCANPSELSKLKLVIWQQYERLQQINGQLISERGQQRLQLQRNDSIRW